MAETREVIQERMLSNISNEYDKTEGSFFYDVIKPVAIELEALYAKAESILDKGFVDTATGENLDKIVGEQGIYRKPATKATGYVTITGTEGTTVNIGDKVASDTVNFIVTESKIIDSAGQVTVSVECEIAGTIGNVPAGAIKYFPITIPGLISVTNKSALINGYNEETDESLRERYYTKVRTPATSGNKWHYLNWAKEVIGVGDARVFPLWNGNGTVKIVIINSNKRAADSILINNVANYIEDNRPIGANVTVVSATEKPININVTLVIDSKNYVLENIKTDIERNIVEYLKKIAFVSNYVSYAQIGNIILNTEGVIDYSNLLLNNGTANITINNEEVAVLGGVVIG